MQLYTTLHSRYGIILLLIIFVDASKTTAIMSTNAIAFLLLSKFRNGATLSQLVDELDNLRDYLNVQNRDVGFSGHSIDIIFSAVSIRSCP